MCSRVFVVVYCGLVLATAGFCLTIAGWFTPSNNFFVYSVRRVGPVLLVFGILILLSSCMMCAIEQDRCFDTCVQCYQERKKRVFQRHLARAVADLHLARNHLSHSDQVVLDRLHHSCEVCDAIRHNYVIYIPAEADRCDDPERHRHLHCDAHPDCDLEFVADHGPRLERFLPKGHPAARSLPLPSCGYQASDETTEYDGDTPPSAPVHGRMPFGSDRIRRAQVANLVDRTTSHSGTLPSVYSGRGWSYAKQTLPNDTPRDSTDDATRSTPTTTSPMVTPSSGRKYCVNNIRQGKCPSTGDLLAATRAMRMDDDLVWTPRIDYHVTGSPRNDTGKMTSLPSYKIDDKNCADV